MRCQGSCWIWATPDHEIQYGDLARHRVIAMGRNAAYPARLIGDLYAFDPITAAELEELRAEARALAEVLGVVEEAAGVKREGPRWVISDTALELFGTEVPADITGSAQTFENRNSVGVALVVVDGDERWVSVENVPKVHHQAWLDEKHGGPGRDPRVGPLVRTSGGLRRRSLDEAITAHRFQDWTDWPFRGPRATNELMQSVQASSLGLSAYVNHYISVSGLATTSAHAHELRTLFSILRHMVEVDQLDASNLASAEMVSRRILQMQRAIRRNPRHPDYTGLDTMMANALDESGGIVASKFEEWLGKEAGTAAAVMKQNRMLKEEQDADAKKAAAAAKK